MGFEDEERRLRERKAFFLNGSRWCMSAEMPDDDCQAGADAIASLRRRADENWKMWESNAAATHQAVARALVLEEQLAEANRRAESAEAELRSKQQSLETMAAEVLDRNQRLAAAQAREAGLVRALEPFAQCAGVFDCWDDESLALAIEHAEGKDNPELTIGNLRRAREALAGTAQGREDHKPHPRWKPNHSVRHPQAKAEWDYRNDPAGGALDRSIKRLNVAMDYDDPRAPDQMAVVLRIDLIRLTHDWIHKNAAFHAGVKAAPTATPPGGERQSAHRVCMREVLTWINERREEGCQITAGQANKLLTALASAVERDRAPGGEPTQAAAHDYLSTACYHGLHARCRQSCKFCSVPCRCSCHSTQAATGGEDVPTIRLTDPAVILAGIRQFGLAPDGSDLRDLANAITRARDEGRAEGMTRTETREGEITMIEGFHWREGMYFHRLADGSVEIIQTQGFGASEEIEWRRTVPASEWASIVASVSAQGETGESHRRTLAFHMGPSANDSSSPSVAAGASPRQREPVVDRETAQTLLDLLNPLHGELDRQTYDQRVRENFDAPADAEYNVDITARMERDLTQAVCILENRLHDPQIPPTATPPGGERCIHDPPLCARPNASEDACQAPHCFAPGGEPTQAGAGGEKHPLRDRLHDIVLRELRNLSRDSSDDKRALFIVSGLMANAARLFYRPTQAGAGNALAPPDGGRTSAALSHPGPGEKVG